MDAEMREFFERGVAAIERLAQDPEITVPALPAVCPFCEQMNPVVRVEESATSGRLAEFVIKAHCLSCNEIFYALPLQFICVRTEEDALEADKERQEHNGYSN